jgi:hypothetical protein
MAEVRNPRERRRFSRITFHRPAMLDLRTLQAEAEVLDVSLKGALVQVRPGLELQRGATASLVIRLDAGDAQIRMDGELAHVEGSRVGFACEEIDLESVEHLRRLVELNLDDEAALRRELGELVGERD